jgi:aconitate hydratase
MAYCLLLSLIQKITIKILEDDRISIINLHQLAENLPVKVVIKHANGQTEAIVCNHSFSEGQLNWFRAGSALNALAQEA